MLKNYIITALRNLWRSKFFSFINIFGLSIGIACCMLIFLYAKDEWTFDRFHKKSESIYRLTADISSLGNEVNKTGNSGLIQGPVFKEKIPEVQDYVRLESMNCNVKKDNVIFPEEGLWADANFFSVFSFPALYGSEPTALNDMHSVVLSEDLAEKYFGRKDVIGQTLLLSEGKDFVPFTITAVLKNSPKNSSIKLQMLLPMSYRLSQQKEEPHWMNFFLNTFLVIKPGTDITALNKKLNHIYNKEAAEQIKKMQEVFDFKETVVYGLQPLLAMHLSKDYLAQNGLVNDSNPIYSYILSGIAFFVLVIACINFVNLAVSRSLKRAREIGVRKVMGGRRKDLIFQFLGESYVLALFSFLLAIFLVVLILPFFNTMSGKSLAFSYLLDARLILGYFALFILTGWLAGFYPALVLSGFKPVETLYGKLKFSGKNYLSRGLVIVQFTLATILIVSTVGIYSQFNYLINYDLGYDKRDVVQVRGGKMNKQKLEVLRAELVKDPSIRNVAAQQGGEYITIAKINGGKDQEFGYNLVDEETFPMFRIPVVKGRGFSKEFPGDSTASLLVNEAFVKAAGWKNPVGEIIDFYYKNKKYQVVGVVRDFHNSPLTEKLRPQVFSMNPEVSYQLLNIKIDPSKKVEALAHIEKTIKAFFPYLPYDHSFLEENVQDRYKKEAKWKQIIFASALLTIFISCIGLFGLAALSSEKRAKEIGIRKVLGASVSWIVRKLSADFVKLVLVSGLLAAPFAWWIVNKWLENYPYHIDLHAGLFIFPVLLVVLIAMIAVSFQAIKAAVANPVKSLRSE